MADQTQADLSAPQPASAVQVGSPDVSQTNPSTATGEVRAQASPATRPEWLPESFWDAEKSVAKGDDFKKHLTQLETFKTDTEAALGTVPSKPEDYKLELPGGTAMPKEFDEMDPRFPGLTKLAHKHKLSQGALSDLVQFDLDNKIASTNTLQQQITARDAALGENGAARVKSITDFIDSHWSKPEEARQIRDTMWTPVIVKHFETYQKMLSTQGAHSFTQTGRDHEAGDGKPEGFDKWKPIDQLQWNRQQKAAAPRH